METVTAEARQELKWGPVGREACKERMGKADPPPPPHAKVCRRLDYRLATSGLTLLI